MAINPLCRHIRYGHRLQESVSRLRGDVARLHAALKRGKMTDAHEARILAGSLEARAHKLRELLEEYSEE